MSIPGLELMIQKLSIFKIRFFRALEVKTPQMAFYLENGAQLPPKGAKGGGIGMVGYKRSQMGVTPSGKSPFSGLAILVSFLTLISGAFSLCLAPLGILTVLNVKAPVSVEISNFTSGTHFQTQALSETHVLALGFCMCSAVVFLSMIMVDFLTVMGPLLWTRVPSRLWVATALCLQYCSLITMVPATSRCVETENCGILFWTFWLAVCLCNLVFWVVGSRGNSKVNRLSLTFVPHKLRCLHKGKWAKVGRLKKWVSTLNRKVPKTVVFSGCGKLNGALDLPMGRGGRGGRLSPGTPPPPDGLWVSPAGLTKLVPVLGLVFWTSVCPFWGKLGNGPEKL